MLSAHLTSFSFKVNVISIEVREMQVENICLISKEDLVPLYKNAGFQSVGKSNIQHGKDAWIDLEMSLVT